VAVVVIVGCAGWFFLVSRTADHGPSALSRAVLAAALGLAINVTTRTQVDWRLAGLAGLVLGWLGWLALAIGLVSAKVTDAVLESRHHSAEARRRRTGLVLAGATALIGAVSALPHWDALQQFLPASWRS
jgi:hypothetical protein